MTEVPTNLDEVIDQICGILDDPPASLAGTDDLFVAGLDSIRLMLLTDRWSESGVDVDPIDLLSDPTPAGFWAAIQKASAGT